MAGVVARPFNWVCVDNNQGNQRKLSGNMDGSIESYSKGSLIDSRHTSIYYNRARCWQYGMQRRQHVMHRALVFDPKHSESYFELAKERKSLKDLPGGAQQYGRSITVAAGTPASRPATTAPDSYANLGNISPDKASAARCYQRCIGLNTWHAHAYWNHVILQDDESWGAALSLHKTIVVHSFDGDAYASSSEVLEELAEMQSVRASQFGSRS